MRTPVWTSVRAAAYAEAHTRPRLVFSRRVVGRAVMR